MSTKPKVIHGSVKNKIVSSDLQDERNNKDFDDENGQALNRIVLSQQEIDIMQQTDQELEADPILRNSHEFYELSPQELQPYMMNKLRRAYEINKDKWFTNYKPGDFHWAGPMLGETHTSLHSNMFLISLYSLTTDEQFKKWVPLAQNYDILGSYAQTEIGHGSDVPSLETTATFDRKTDEFIIHTPSPTATKYWPGDLGHFSSHTIVFAKLIIDEVTYGVFPFIIQVRDTKTWKFIKGFKGGDIGPKLGYHIKNNSWATFDQMRIPRDQMLMKYTKVDRDGKFSLDGDLRALYSTMMAIRVGIVIGSAHMLQRGCLISLRYSSVRKQFKNNVDNKLETKLIDYQTQQLKLFPLLSLSYALKFAFHFINDQYKDMLAQVEKGNFDMLDQMHHLTSGYKSYSSQTCVDGLNVIRQSIGGAGFSCWSGIPFLIGEFTPATTYEGDNTVMAQQAFKFLQKLYKKVRKNQKVTGIYSYLNNIDELIKMKLNTKSAEDFTNIDFLEHALQACTAYSIEKTMKLILKSEANETEIVNHLYAPEIVNSTLNHIKYITFAIFKTYLPKIKDVNLRGHCTNMNVLNGLMYIQQCQSEGYDSGLFKQGDSQLIQEAIAIVLKKIRPQAVNLIELSGISDHVITSAVGNKYGDIFEQQLEWAMTSRMNTPGDNIPPKFMEYMGPILHGKL